MHAVTRSWFRRIQWITQRGSAGTAGFAAELLLEPDLSKSLAKNAQGSLLVLRKCLEILCCHTFSHVHHVVVDLDLTRPEWNLIGTKLKQRLSFSCLPLQVNMSSFSLFRLTGDVCGVS